MADREQESEWSAVRDLFEHCLELDATARALRLRAVSPTVRAEVEDLLAEHESSDGRLDAHNCHAAFLAASTEILGVGSQLAGYRILATLGRGGMGTVYLAEQDTPRRRVAIKLVTSASVGRESIQRFQLEAELLGQLRHPGIAQVYEVGVHHEVSPAGTMQWPFFAMEFVEGAMSLSEWSQERAPTDRQKIAVVLQVCAAVQHAHERGVVHRDLKPQNILIDHAGHAKVIDFGVARTTDQPSELTQAGELVGTLRYMSPEQVRGNDIVDTRTDVHALGVLLYELLTGRLPFDFGDHSLPEVGRIICEEQPRALRRDAPQAHPDLELILATAMAKESGRRYAQAGSIAEELQRYLRCEPINARPPTLHYQLRMFARRRRGLVAAVTALLLVATAGGATSLVYAYRASQAEQLAVREGQEKLGAMRRVFDNAMKGVIGLPRRLTGFPGATKLRRDVVEDAIDQLQFVEDSVPLDNGMRYSLAVAYHDLAGIQGGMFMANEGDHDGAKRSLLRADTYLLEVLRVAPNNIEALWLRFDVATQSGDLVFAKSRSAKEAQQHWKTAKALLDNLRSALPPGDLRVAGADAVVISRDADLARMNQDYDSAVKLYQKARTLRLTSFGDGPLDDDAQLALGSLHRSLALSEQSRGNMTAAFAAFEQSIAALTKVERTPSNRRAHSLLAMVRSHFGYTLASTGQYERGEEHLRWAQTELERLLATDPSNAGFTASAGTASQRLAEHLAISGKYAKEPAAARLLYQEAQAFAERGLELGKSSLTRGRDMINIFLVSECERIIAACQAALR